ncbi:hypothetical protein [Brevibacterium spongiae]|uniref:Uncharacterized protein n=1 Tax=Brevibacterium spongiae TaxID=2909672 RepID=A0ABY5SIX8_9MICO|nr:hypothetical protein [Brevibacterium spongiae]UVI34468.1 hypothetical protein L1F31_09950 [Brevibacterium spongiae]
MTPHSLRSRLRPWLWFTVLLCLGSLVVFGSVAADPGGSVVASNDDTSLFIWWLGHGAAVLADLLGFGSGHTGGLLYTESMNALGGGVNGAWNTSLAGIALLLAPVTWAAGPIVAYNLLILSIPVLNSLATAVLFRRFMGRLPAFIAAGGVGFSSYVIAQLGGHPNLAFAITPPLTAWAILALLGSAHRGRRHVSLIGLGFGLLLGFQFYVSTEVLAGTFLAAVCFFICLAVFGHRLHPVRAWLSLALGSLIAAAVALLCAIPLLLTMTGANAPAGAIRPHGVWNTDLLDPILPAAPAWLSGGVSPLPRVMDIDPAELGAYVGAPALLAALIIVLAALRKTPRAVPVRIAAATGVLVFVLALGSPILLGGNVLAETGPFALVEAIPVLNNILPMRLVLHSTIALFAILGIGLDWALAHRHLIRARILSGLLALNVICVVPAPQTAHDVTVPDFYTQSIAEVVPAGSVVKTFPRPLAWAEPHADEAMVWQAVSGFRYRETGGYFIGSSPESPVTYTAPEDALDTLLHGSVFDGAPMPDPESREVSSAITELRESGVDFIVLAPEAPLLPGGEREYSAFLDTAVGSPVFADEGVRVYRLGQ